MVSSDWWADWFVKEMIKCTSSGSRGWFRFSSCFDTCVFLFFPRMFSILSNNNFQPCKANSWRYFADVEPQTQELLWQEAATVWGRIRYQHSKLGWLNASHDNPSRGFQEEIHWWQQISSSQLCLCTKGCYATKPSGRSFQQYASKVCCISKWCFPACQSIRFRHPTMPTPFASLARAGRCSGTGVTTENCKEQGARGCCVFGRWPENNFEGNSILLGEELHGIWEGRSLSSTVGWYCGKAPGSCSIFAVLVARALCWKVSWPYNRVVMFLLMGLKGHPNR